MKLNNKERTLSRAAVFALLFAGVLLIASCGGKSSSVPATTEVSGGPGGMAAVDLDISADGSRLYIANNIRGQVVVMDTASMSVAGAFGLGSRARYIQYLEDDDLILVSHEWLGEGQMFSIYDMNDGEVANQLEWSYNDNSIGEGAKSFVVYDDTVYIANAIGSMATIDISGTLSSATVTALAGFMTGGSALGSAVSEDEQKMYVTKSGETNLYIYDLAAGASLGSVALAGCSNPYYMDANDANGMLFIACRSNSKKLMVFDMAAGAASGTVTVGGTNPTHVTVSGNGDYVFVTNQGNDTVTMLDADTDEVLKTFKTGDHPSGIAEHYPYIYVANLASGSISRIDYVNERSIEARVGAALTPAFQ